MATQLFFHNALSTQTGTLPTATQSGTTPSFIAFEAASLRQMDTSIGVLQTTIGVGNIPSTAQQKGFIRSFISAPLIAQTIAADTITYFGADSEDNGTMNFWMNGLYVYVWRPSTGAKIGVIFSNLGPIGGLEPTSANSEQVTTFTTATTTAVTVQAGDVIICELWTTYTQGNGTAHSGVFYYDGTTSTGAENAVIASAASNIQFNTNTIAFAVNAPPDDDSWWSSVMQSGATVALATALSIAAMTGVANSQPVWQDEVPQQQPETTLVMEEDAAYLPPPIPATLQYPQQWSFDTPEDITHIDEDYWPIPAPVQATNLYPQQWPFDEQIPTSVLTQVDEDYWQNSVPPLAASFTYPPQASFDEQIPATLSGQPDEDYWANPTAPTLATLLGPQRWSFDEQIPAGLFGQPEEDYWRNPAAPVVASLTYPSQWTFDEQIPISSPVEEDYWQNRVPAVPLSMQYPSAWTFEQNESPTLSGQPDEDYWSNPVAPVVASLYQSLPLGDREEIPAGSLYGVPDTDVWINPVAPVQASLSIPQQWSFDPSDINFTQYDEDFWNNPVRPVPLSFASLPQWAFDPQDVPSFGLDEDFWSNPTSPVQLSFLLLQPSTFEQNDSPTLSGQPDEDYWRNQVAPVQAEFRLLQPFLFEQDETASLSAQPDEDYWQNQVPPVQAINLWPQPFNFEQDDPTTLYGVPEVDIWVNPAPLQPTQNIVFSVVDDDFVSPVSLGEDYWINPVSSSTQTNTGFTFSSDDEVPVFLAIEEEPWLLGRVHRTSWNPIRPVWVDGDEVEIAPPAEDYWQSSVAPVQAKLRRLVIPDVEVLPSSSTSIEDYWFRVLSQKSITNTTPKQWAFDENESPSEISNVPVIVEMFSVLDIITSDGEFVDIVKAVSFTVKNLPIVVDISCVDHLETDNFRVGDVVEIIMPIPSVITYTQLNEKYLILGPVLETLPPNLPIVGATVLASLYANRSFGDPGTVVPQLHNLVLVDEGEGVYQGLMSDPSFDPAPGQFYTTVIDLTGGGAQGHWEIPSVVLPRIS